MTATVEIDKLGRLVIPKKFREALHLRAGDKLDVEVSDDKLTMSPKRRGKGLIEKNGFLVFDSGVPMSKKESLRLVDDMREDAWRPWSRESSRSDVFLTLVRVP